ncbi:8783_t:CDS:2 [Ambispora leptoticha]|uniref:RNA exonuclease 4 n=1 Tax=Ambispora leptoticha TaxID=144679 RepID=A0A9N9G7U6_9GLOM|nr:8783_t:CDS:2 [Ambispora leptoticha]
MSNKSKNNENYTIIIDSKDLKQKQVIKEDETLTAERRPKNDDELFSEWLMLNERPIIEDGDLATPIQKQNFSLKVPDSIIMPTNTISSTDSKYLALDCEMVGIGERGIESALARVSIVDFECNRVLDEYVKPEQPITDYRTEYSGITKDSLINASSLKDVQGKVSEIIKDKIVVGHSIHLDFSALQLPHLPELTRDISIYGGIRNKLPKNKVPSLKTLAKKFLDIDIQSGEHDSIEDATATMNIYKHFQAKWEKDIENYGFQATIYETPKCFDCNSILHFRSNCPYNSLN